MVPCRYISYLYATNTITLNLVQYTEFGYDSLELGLKKLKIKNSNKAFRT